MLFLDIVSQPFPQQSKHGPLSLLLQPLLEGHQRTPQLHVLAHLSFEVGLAQPLSMGPIENSLSLRLVFLHPFAKHV